MKLYMKVDQSNRPQDTPVARPAFVEANIDGKVYNRTATNGWSDEQLLMWGRYASVNPSISLGAFERWSGGGEYDEATKSVTPAIKALSLEDAKRHAIQTVRDTATILRAELAGTTDMNRLSSWSDKMRRAERIIADQASAEDKAIVKVEADLRGKGETPEQLAAKQKAKGMRLATAVSTIDGKEEQAIARINAVAKLKDLISLSDTLKAEADALFQKLKPDEIPAQQS